MGALLAAAALMSGSALGQDPPASGNSQAASASQPAASPAAAPPAAAPPAAAKAAVAPAVAPAAASKSIPVLTEREKKCRARRRCAMRGPCPPCQR